MLWVSVIANAVGLVFQPFIAVVCDRVGRKPIFVTGCIGSAVLIFAYFGAISSGNIILVALAASALIGVTYGAVNAIYTRILHRDVLVAGTYHRNGSRASSGLIVSASRRRSRRCWSVMSIKIWTKLLSGYLKNW